MGGVSRFMAGGSGRGRTAGTRRRAQGSAGGHRLAAGDIAGYEAQSLPFSFPNPRQAARTDLCAAGHKHRPRARDVPTPLLLLLLLLPRTLRRTAHIARTATALRCLASSAAAMPLPPPPA